MKHHARKLPIIAAVLFGMIVFFQLGIKPLKEQHHFNKTNKPSALSTASVVSKDVDLSTDSASTTPVVPDSNPSQPSSLEEWISHFETASPEMADQKHRKGLALVKARNAKLKNLIQTDPEAAIEAALTWSEREALPPEFQQYLEKPINALGDYGVMVGSDFKNGESTVNREVIIGNQTYQAFVYGKNLTKGSAGNIPLNGIAIDDVIALAESPIRVLDQDEALALKTIPASTDPTCVITGEPTDTADEEIAVEVAGDIHYACRASHLYTFEQWVAGDTGGISGSGDLPVALDSWSQGPKSLLFIRVNFPDDLLDPISESAAYNLMNRVNDWMVENSYDTTSIVTTVTPLLTLPNTKAFYSKIGDSQLLADARTVARAAGYDTADFNLDAVRFRSVPGYSYGGKAYVRGKGCWLQSSSLGIVCHELGHNYGLWHANYWQAQDNSIIGPGSHKEYGDIFDTMGSAGAGDKHFSAVHRNKVDWLGDSYIHDVNGSGTFTIHAYDIPALDSEKYYAIKVKRDYDRDYWVELRHLFSSNKHIQNGVLVRWDPWSKSSGGAHLLDTTPGSPASSSSRSDAALVLGRTFSDVAAGIYITPIAMRGTGSEKSVDVVINSGDFSDNQAPTVSIQATTNQSGTGENVVFTATANDPDGDPLAYEWTYGDLNFGPNSPIVTNSWNGNGDYVVRCRVSDMKGGFGSAFTMIKIGSPSTHTIAGRVTDELGNPIEGVHVSNGSTSTSSYRGNYSDSDGNYVITKLSGNYTISAALYGYELNPIGAWSNTLDVTADLTGIDFGATAEPAIGIQLVDKNASEDSNDPGVFRISRTGPTEFSLTVKYLRTGTARHSSDYTLSPTPVGSSPFSITIPAGKDHVDILATPNQDSSREGTETVILTLDANSAYVIGQTIEETLFILDDESANKPSMSVSSASSSADNRVTESGSDQGVFSISRYGNKSDDVTIYFAFEGTATAGTDYVQPTDSITMLAGESKVNVPFHPFDDALVEGDETVILKLVNDDAYTLNTSSATVTIQDDDPTLIKVFSTDTLAIEDSSNKATFVIQRIGAVADSLTVHYSTSGTAVEGEDFATLPGSIVIPAGNTFSTLSINPLSDTVLEGDESVALVIENAPTYNVAMPGSSVVTIQDNELPTITLTAQDSTATEGGGDSGLFRFSRNSNTSGDLIVEYSVSGNSNSPEDYSPLSGSITIPDGESSVDLSVIPTDDSIKEDDEKVTLQLTQNTNYNTGTIAPITVTIRDNDSTGSIAVGFESATSTTIESNTSIKLPVVISDSTGSDITVNYAISGGTAMEGSDFNLSNGSITIPAGDTLATINFYLINDSSNEADETVMVQLSASSIALLDVNTTHVLTIIDDDAGIISVSAVDETADESGDPGVFRISRTGGISGDMPVHFQITGTASSPGDYAPLPSSIVIPDGSSSVDLTVIAANDETEELDETVTLRITSVDGGRIGSPSLATVTITDIYEQTVLPTITVATDDDQTTEGIDDPAQLRILRSDDLAGKLAVTLSISGTTTSGSDYIALNNTIVFSDSQTEFHVNIQAISDGVEEPLEELVVTISPSADYVIGIENSGKISFIDSPFMGWQFAEFSTVELGDVSVSGPEADPDQDGVVNFVEYAFNRDPHISDAKPFIEKELLPLAGSSEELLHITYTRRINRTGFQYSLAVSEDLFQWDDNPINFEVIDVLDDDNGITETVKVRVLYPTLHFDKTFVVLQILKE